MSFGLINVSVTFQALVNDVLRKFLDIFTLTYLDDILIYLRTKKEHKEHVRQVLYVLKGVHLLIKLKKYEFYRQKVKFLSYILITNGIQMNEFKIQTVLN